MRTIQTAMPRRELREFVRCYAQREIRCADSGLAQADFATVDQVLAFNLQGETYLDYADGRSRRAPKVVAYGPIIDLGGGAHFIGHILGFAIFLTPLAFWQLFRIPTSAFTDKDCDGGDLLGKRIEELWLMLAESKTFQERVRLAEKYLLPFAAAAGIHSSIMKTAQEMIRHGGATRIDELANQTGFCVRHYERRFAEEIGVSPQWLSTVLNENLPLNARMNERIRNVLGLEVKHGPAERVRRANGTLAGPREHETIRRSQKG